eukprot:Rmarinus@m.14040
MWARVVDCSLQAIGDLFHKGSRVYHFQMRAHATKRIVARKTDEEKILHSMTLYVAKGYPKPRSPRIQMLYEMLSHPRPIENSAAVVSYLHTFDLHRALDVLSKQCVRLTDTPTIVSSLCAVGARRVAIQFLRDQVDSSRHVLCSPDGSKRENDVSASFDEGNTGLVLVNKNETSCNSDEELQRTKSLVFGPITAVIFQASMTILHACSVAGDTDTLKIFFDMDLGSLNDVLSDFKLSSAAAAYASEGDMDKCLSIIKQMGANDREVALGAVRTMLLGSARFASFSTLLQLVELLHEAKHYVSTTDFETLLGAAARTNDHALLSFVDGGLKELNTAPTPYFCLVALLLTHGSLHSVHDTAGLLPGDNFPKTEWLARCLSYVPTHLAAIKERVFVRQRFKSHRSILRKRKIIETAIQEGFLLADWMGRVAHAIVLCRLCELGKRSDAERFASQFPPVDVVRAFVLGLACAANLKDVWVFKRLFCGLDRMYPSWHFGHLLWISKEWPTAILQLFTTTTEMSVQPRKPYFILNDFFAACIQAGEVEAAWDVLQIVRNSYLRHKNGLNKKKEEEEEEVEESLCDIWDERFSDNSPSQLRYKIIASRWELDSWRDALIELHYNVATTLVHTSSSRFSSATYALVEDLTDSLLSITDPLPSDWQLVREHILKPNTKDAPVDPK